MRIGASDSTCPLTRRIEMPHTHTNGCWYAQTWHIKTGSAGIAIRGLGTKAVSCISHRGLHHPAPSCCTSPRPEEQHDYSVQISSHSLHVTAQYDSGATTAVCRCDSRMQCVERVSRRANRRSRKACATLTSEITRTRRREGDMRSIWALRWHSGPCSAAGLRQGGGRGGEWVERVWRPFARHLVGRCRSFGDAGTLRHLRPVAC